MSSRSITHEETFRVSAEALFASLVQPSAIRAWWSATNAIVLAEPGGTWCATWGGGEDTPDYVTIATIREFEPHRRLVLADYRYRAKDGPLPFEADFVTEFLVTPDGAGARLRVTQAGFPAAEEADAFFAGCAQGWRDTFAGLQRFHGGG